MEDRASAHPGRYKFTNVSTGEEIYFDVEHADKPTTEGTAYNKLNILPDAVAEAIGLDPNDNPAPAAAFNIIGTVPLDIQEEYKPLIAPLSVTLSGFVSGSYLYYGIPWDSELRVFVKVSKTTAMSVTTAIGTLPSGYRPAAAQTLTAYDSSGNAIPGVTVTIGTDGTVAVAGSVDANTVVMASYNSSESGGGGGV